MRCLIDFLRWWRCQGNPSRLWDIELYDTVKLIWLKNTSGTYPYRIE